MENQRVLKISTGACGQDRGQSPPPPHFSSKNNFFEEKKGEGTAWSCPQAPVKIPSKQYFSMFKEI